MAERRGGVRSTSPTPEPPCSSQSGTGQWVPPELREKHQWYQFDCRCGQTVTFPWLGCQHVTCPTCNEVSDNYNAVPGPTPPAAVQAAALLCEQDIEKQLNAQLSRAEKAKQFAEKFQCIKSVGDKIESLLFCGKPTRYGNVKMYCGGRIVLPPSSSFIIIPALIILPPYLLSMQCVLSSARSRMLLNLLLGISWTALLGAHMTEPGIQLKEPSRPPMRDLEEELGGYQVLRKWCRTCNIHRPPRTSHCSTCNVCVDQFDHHCHVTGTCVGRRNLFPFVLFAVFVFLSNVFALFSSLHALYYGVPEQCTSKAAIVTVWTLFCLCGTFGIVSGLWGVLSTGLTTREFIKRVWAPGNHPYDRGTPLGNLSAALCERRPPSRIWGKTATQLAISHDPNV